MGGEGSVTQKVSWLQRVSEALGIRSGGGGGPKDVY
jgi:hypothetical protein